MPKLMQGEKIEMEITEICNAFLRDLIGKGYLFNGELFTIMEREAKRYNYCLELRHYQDGSVFMTFGRIT